MSTFTSTIENAFSTMMETIQSKLDKITSANNVFADVTNEMPHNSVISSSELCGETDDMIDTKGGMSVIVNEMIQTNRINLSELLED